MLLYFRPNGESPRPKSEQEPFNKTRMDLEQFLSRPKSQDVEPIVVKSPRENGECDYHGGACDVRVSTLCFMLYITSLYVSCTFLCHHWRYMYVKGTDRSHIVNLEFHQKHFFFFPVETCWRVAFFPGYSWENSQRWDLWRSAFHFWLYYRDGKWETVSSAGTKVTEDNCVELDHMALGYISPPIDSSFSLFSKCLISKTVGKKSVCLACRTYRTPLLCIFH